MVITDMTFEKELINSTVNDIIFMSTALSPSSGLIALEKRGGMKRFFDNQAFTRNDMNNYRTNDKEYSIEPGFTKCSTELVLTSVKLQKSIEESVDKMLIGGETSKLKEKMTMGPRVHSQDFTEFTVEFKISKSRDASSL